MFPRQETVGLDNYEAGSFGDTLPKQKGVPRSVENDNAIARLTVLKKIRADEEVSAVPSRQEIHARLLRTRTNAEHLAVKAVIATETVRII